VIALTRCYALPAAHVLSHPSLSAEENDRIYGKCANPAGHGHDYGLEIAVSGPVDPVTGRIFDPDALDAIVEERVLSRFAYRRLNDDPAFRERVPTAENIAVVIHDELEAPIAAHRGARLVGVTVHETRKSSFAYGELE
jgi:6-pyruvoyltetrahydropterin/6-carboxytetrahydropterin synthase